MRRRSIALTLVTLAAALWLLAPRPARAFGDQGAFDPRILLAGGATGPSYLTAPSRWSWELIQRTSAPARLKPSQVRADDAAITDAPFLYWSGRTALTSLSAAEVAGLRKFFALGGTLLVDDATPAGDGEPGPFGRSARKEIARVLPDSTPIELGSDHVIFKAFYLLGRPEGRVAGKKTVDAIVRGGQAQVVFLSHDLGGALAKGPSGIWEQAVVPGGDEQRERAIRLAVNLAMYVLCSNYKDDQVHAPFLMRRRAMLPEP